MEFLGFISYYNCVIPQAAMLLAPLKNLLKGASNSSKPLEWGQGANNTFNNIKQQLISLTCLTYAILHAPTVLSTDAEAVGAVLQKEVDGELSPLPSSERG